MDPRLAVYKIFMIFKLRYIVLNLLLLSPDFLFFLIFHNPVMIYNTRNRNNDKTENQKEKRPVLMLIQEESET